MPLVLSELYKKTDVHIDSLGECELRHLSYDDSAFATELLLPVKDAREYTARVLHHQLKKPEVSYDRFAELPDDDLRKIARAFIPNNQFSFEYFTETSDDEFFDNFRKAISAHFVEFSKKLTQIMNSYGTSLKTTFDSIAFSTKHLASMIDSVGRSSKQLIIQYNDVFKDFARAIVDFRSYVDSTLDFRDVQAALAGLQKTYINPGFYKEYNSILSQLALAWNPTTHSNFNRHILELIDNAIRSKGQDTDVRIIEQLIDEKIDSLPKDNTSLQGLSFLLAVLTLILQFYQTYLSQEQLSDSKGSGTAQTETLNETKVQTELINRLVDGISRITSELQGTRLNPDSSTYYIVQRSANLRVKCTSKSAVISKLYPNQRLRLVQRKHEWIYIEYFDYVDAVPRTGWVLKKYLKLIE